GIDADNLAIGGRQGEWPGGERAFGVAEKPSAERCQDEEREGEHRPKKGRKHDASRSKTEEVVDAVANHAQLLFYVAVGFEGGRLGCIEIAGEVKEDGG